MEKQNDLLSTKLEKQNHEQKKPFPAFRLTRRTARSWNDDELYHPNGLEPFYDTITGTILYE